MLDFFCGSGTTLEAAQSLGRKWIGVDSSEIAIAVARERMEKVCGAPAGESFQVVKAAEPDCAPILVLCENQSSTKKKKTARRKR